MYFVTVSIIIHIILLYGISPYFHWYRVSLLVEFIKTKFNLSTGTSLLSQPCRWWVGGLLLFDKYGLMESVPDPCNCRRILRVHYPPRAEALLISYVKHYDFSFLNKNKPAFQSGPL